MSFIGNKEILGTLKDSVARKKSAMQGDREGTKCIFCHRNLKKPESIELRMGPVCRHKMLLKEAERRQLDLFA